MACKYTVGGVTYTERQFKEFLAGKVKSTDLDAFVSELSGVDAGSSKRAATQRVLSSDKYSQEFKDAITEKTIYYRELPNQVTEAEAEAIIDTQGEEATDKALKDFNNGMPSAVRFAVLQKLIDRLEAQGEN